MDHEGYYAEAFYPEPGQCFRMISSSTHGAPALCPKPVDFRGRFQDGTGRWHEVWSCIDHAGDLPDWKRVSASVTDISEAPKSTFRKGVRGGYLTEFESASSFPFAIGPRFRPRVLCGPPECVFSEPALWDTLLGMFLTPDDHSVTPDARWGA